MSLLLFLFFLLPSCTIVSFFWIGYISFFIYVCFSSCLMRHVFVNFCYYLSYTYIHAFLFLLNLLSLCFLFQLLFGVCNRIFLFEFCFFVIFFFFF
ncbi:hypothetical protein DFH27DRAFT_546281, partial [Peziza echinospora]